MGALDYHPAHLILQQKVKNKRSFYFHSLHYLTNLRQDQGKIGVKPRPKTHKKRFVS